MNPFRNSLYWRLLIWFCVANLLVLMLGGFLTRRLVEYTTAVEMNWVALAKSADEAYQSGGSDALADWSRQQRQQGIEATLFDNGVALYPIRLHPSVERSLPALLAAGHDTVLQPWPGLYVAVQQVTGADGQLRQLVALSRTHTHMAPQTRGKIFLAFQALLSLVFIGLLGWWLARSVAGPVEALRDATRRMTSGELSARVGRRGRTAHNELAQLARDFDAMAERIEALVAHDRGVLQDLSHELRSPLARLNLILELARRSNEPSEAEKYFQQAETEIARLDRMTGEMLTLSRLEGGIPGVTSQNLDLSALLRARMASAELEASARKVSLSMLHDEPVQVRGSEQLLERALDNLLANAIKFSPEGGCVECSLRTFDGFADVSIRDHGPGVPEAELSSLFRPFFRGSNAARAYGHGIGLAIVQRVVKIHGGDVHAGNDNPDGLRVSLRLPLLPG